jgi:AAA15 family ATPase/GTPase
MVRTIKNKKGWIRILVSSTLVIINLRFTEEQNKGFEEYIYNLQRGILEDLSNDNTYRKQILETETNQLISQDLITFIEGRTPKGMKTILRICELGEPCKLEGAEVAKTRNAEVYVEETIIAANYNEFKPKKVRLFLWTEE